jgi:hypothetical protein
MWLFLAAAFFAKGQGKTLYEVNILKPKLGTKLAFEESWKEHRVKFHTTDKRSVYEVESGSEVGSYVIVEGPTSYADMDVARPTAKDHGIDMDKSIYPKLESVIANFIVRWADTLSYNSDVKANLSLISTTVIKDGKMAEYMAEVRKAVLLYTKIKAPFSFNTMVKQQAGSSPTLIQIRNLKDGYKELDQDFYKLPNDYFKEAYIKEYGQADWDKRMKIMDEDVVSRTQHFEKLRADLSSK